MDDFVDAMDLREAGDKDETGYVWFVEYPCGAQMYSYRACQPWFDTRLSFNPAIHRVKQAQFHSAVMSDVATHPVPPPHPELTKYFDPPKRVLKTAKDALEECKATFKVKESTYHLVSFSHQLLTGSHFLSSKESSKGTQRRSYACARSRRGHDPPRPKRARSRTARRCTPSEITGHHRFSLACREDKSDRGRL